MRKKLRIYLPFINAGIQEMSTYRVNWAFHLLGDIMGCFVSFFIWIAVFASNDGNDFMGFTISDMVAYIFLTYLTGCIIYSGGTYNIGEEIRDGSISMRMIKPISYNATFLFQEIGNKLMEIGIIFIPLMAGVEIYRFVVMGQVQFDILKLVIYLFSCVLAYLINFSFNICFGFMAFIFKNMWGSNLMKNTIVSFLSGAIVPLAFMPDLLRNVLTYLPFASLSYTPVMVYMGMYTGKDILFYIGIQLFWCVAFWMLSKLIWKCVVNHLTVQGG